MVINFFNAVAREAREVMATLGVRKLDDLIGRPAYLRQREVPDHAKANYLLGIALVGEDPAKAKGLLEKFIALAPNDPDAATAKEMLQYLE